MSCTSSTTSQTRSASGARSFSSRSVIATRPDPAPPSPAAPAPTPDRFDAPRRAPAARTAVHHAPRAAPTPTRTPGQARRADPRPPAAENDPAVHGRDTPTARGGPGSDVRPHSTRPEIGSCGHQPTTMALGERAHTRRSARPRAGARSPWPCGCGDRGTPMWCWPSVSGDRGSRSRGPPAPTGAVEGEPRAVR